MFYHMNKIAVFIFGMCIGSFLNVCIYRLPTSQSISNPPRSVCPNCDGPIRFYDNIPVLSYLLLRGRCRHCNTPISYRYPLVEILSGLFALCAFLEFGATLQGVIYYAFISCLLVITFIDIDHQIIPNAITLPGIPVFFLASFAVPATTYLDSILGLLIGGGSLYLVGWTYYLIKKEEGMGGGDIKLLAMIGALLGWKGVVFTVFIGSTVGTLAGVMVMAYTRLMDAKLRIPFGPFLSIGAITYVFFGSRIIFWYFNALR
jgi:leader peptidase (prepilin peptidase)/N-methyltransferase